MVAACIGGLACILCLLPLLLLLALPSIISFLVYYSPLSADGTITDLRELPNSRIEATYAIAWKLDIPLIGDVTLHTHSQDEKFGQDVQEMQTTISVPNPTPTSLWLHPTNVTLLGPQWDGHQKLAQLGTPDVHFLPGNPETQFMTWIQFADIDRTGHVVTEVLASGSGGDITLQMKPHLSILWFLQVHLDIDKIMRCTVKPVEAATSKRSIAFLRARRPVLSVGQEFQTYGVHESGKEVPNGFRNVRVTCLYVGNA